MKVKKKTKRVVAMTTPIYLQQNKNCTYNPKKKQHPKKRFTLEKILPTPPISAPA